MVGPSWQRLLVRVVAGAGLAAGSINSRPARADCDALFPSPVTQPAQKRAIEPLDLARLRDIESSDSSDLSAPTSLAVSPDGTRVAFVISRGDPATNVICTGLLVVPLDRRSAARKLDIGGEPILARGAYRGSLVVTGSLVSVRPAWSPDGRQVAYLRRDRGVTRLWIAASDGTRAAPIAGDTDGVERFAWSPGGRTLVYSRPVTAAGATREALGGFHYDARFAPNRGFGPQPAAGAPIETFAVSPDGIARRPATVAEAALLEAADPRAGLASDGGSPLTRPRLWALAPGGIRITCRAPTCTGGIVGVFPDYDPSTVFFLRREGWARSRLVMYRWQIGAAHAPRRVWSTGKVLSGCVPFSSRLVCLAESTSAPRRLVIVDPLIGHMVPIFDPNPEFTSLVLGHTERLYWRNDRGLKARGDLVLPLGPTPRGGWPLIVTQYHSDGFLRGGTGDEVPIFPLATRGFAVLSIEQTPIVAVLATGLRSFDDVNAYNARDWAERRSLLSSLLKGVRIVVDRGIADPKRIGLTGLSDGATTVAFALINTKTFAAASISTCCIEPWSAMAIGGPAYADHMLRLGYPPASQNDTRFWAPMSLAQNAGHIHAPLLMQLADDEYLLALQSYTALKEAGQPVDLYVFPDEHHVKWQPAHRLATYDRNIDWFDFWLRHHEDPLPEKEDQYRRWRALRVSTTQQPSG